MSYRKFGPWLRQVEVQVELERRLRQVESGFARFRFRSRLRDGFAALRQVEVQRFRLRSRKR